MPIRGVIGPPNSEVLATRRSHAGKCLPTRQSQVRLALSRRNSVVWTAAAPDGFLTGCDFFTDHPHICWVLSLSALAYRTDGDWSQTLFKMARLSEPSRWPDVGPKRGSPSCRTHCTTQARRHRSAGLDTSHFCGKLAFNTVHFERMRIALFQPEVQQDLLMGRSHLLTASPPLRKVTAPDKMPNRQPPTTLAALCGVPQKFDSFSTPKCADLAHHPEQPHPVIS